jgi:hypothetical protein
MTFHPPLFKLASELTEQRAASSAHSRRRTRPTRLGDGHLPELFSLSKFSTELRLPKVAQLWCPERRRMLRSQRYGFLHFCSDKRRTSPRRARCFVHPRIRAISLSLASLDLCSASSPKGVHVGANRVMPESALSVQDPASPATSKKGSRR